ncbi:MAG: hypothetical protein HRU27_11405 [Rhizobiaceae bacterium]|nr:hypothetical protein [Hyphomicrobiales bacterium]NRB31189.1 hypothetical protein [Rhizobiaceae bacterium]
MSDKADWAAAVTAEANNHAVAPFAAGDDDAPVTNTDNMGAAQAFTAGLANGFARVTAVHTVAWAIPIAETVVTVIAKAEAESGTTDIDAAADVGVGSAAGCSKRAHGKGAGDDD